MTHHVCISEESEGKMRGKIMSKKKRENKWEGQVR
jgi:hypothetical protein